MMGPMDPDELISALRRPAAYPHRFDGAVEVLQTHISVILFAGDRVYKVKKPVDMGFLDYSTLERRRHFCEAEVRLNRELAPGVYHRVVPITREPDGTLRIDGDGAIVEHAVEMTRLPDHRMLAAMLERGEIDAACIAAIVERLATFHRGCPTGPGIDEHAAPDELTRQATDNLTGIARFAADPPAGVTTLSATLHAHLSTHALDLIERHRSLFERRLREGRVREGHGDVHAGNICLWNDAIIIYDRIEFSPRFRCRDVACEIAFLAMDLDLRGCRGFARDLVRRYAERTDDADMPALVPFYKLHLAIVRGKVASLRAVDPALPAADREASRREAMRYFHLAASYTLPRPLVVMCGPPGTGKSWAAQAIARPFEAVVLRSDVVRKTMAGLAPTTRGGPELYTPEQTQRTYEALATTAAAHLTAGRAVVVDATFATAAQRAPFVALAEESSISFVLVERRAETATVRERLAARVSDSTEASDADEQVHATFAGTFEPPTEIAPARRIVLGELPAPEDAASAVVDALIA